MTLELKVRNLQSGELGSVTFPNEVEAHAWLRDRPKWVDVLGCVTKIAPETNAALKASNRPYDAEEQALITKGIEAQKAEAQKRVDAERKYAVAEDEARKKAAASGDMNRIMELHWTYDHGIEKSDKYDERPVTEEAKAAVLAWVAERNEWVAGRGQMVGDARCKVWPGELPKGAEERIAEGRFVPVTKVDHTSN